MESTRIKVTTIDYYHRDKNMKVTCGLLPKKLNSNRLYFDDPSLKVPIINLDIEVSDSGAGENQMESLLEYIRQKGWPNGQKPDFVTNKQLLKCVASDEFEEINVEVFRMDDVVFMLKTSQEKTGAQNFGTAFERFMTRKSEDEKIDNDASVKKAVFVAEIPRKTSKETFKVMYSGEIDAIDDSNQHYELKVFVGGLSQYFWENRSCSCYWQCILSNVPTLVAGSRTGRQDCDPRTLPPKSLPPLSLYNITPVMVQDMPAEVKKKYYARNGGKFNLKDMYWNVYSCEERLKKFLSLVSLCDTGCSYRFSKSKTDSEWTVERKEGPQSSFEKLVTDYVPQTSSTSHDQSPIVLSEPEVSIETENVPSNELLSKATQHLRISSKSGKSKPKPMSKQRQQSEGSKTTVFK